jgi:hypothetical protein
MLDGYAAFGGIRISRRNRSTRRKSTTMPLCPPQIPHYLTWDRTPTAAVESRRLTAWAMARPHYKLCWILSAMMWHTAKPLLCTYFVHHPSLIRPFHFGNRFYFRLSWTAGERKPTLRSSVFRDITACNSFKINRRFGRRYLLQFQGRRVCQWRIQHEACSKQRYYIPEVLISIL